MSTAEVFSISLHQPKCVAKEKLSTQKLLSEVSCNERTSNPTNSIHQLKIHRIKENVVLHSCNAQLGYKKKLICDTNAI